HCKSDVLSQVKAIVTAGKQADKDLSYIQGLLHQYDSVRYARSLARDYAAKARLTLSIYEDSLPKQALLTLTDYVVDRDL
ncbi:MAG: hypothetical protein HZA19_04215, partial [Nitrospirae bacterium]|nr:hypothetical protein [Nitrospirota bacterium]